VTGAFGTAVDLVGLVRTDYTLTASTVSAPPAELAGLVAAQLAAADVQVEADTFSALIDSASMTTLKGLQSQRDDAVELLSSLQKRLAPVEAELAAIKDRLAVVEKEWVAAAADPKPSAAVLRAAADALAQQALRREQAAGPARTTVVFAVKVVEDVDSAVAALVDAPEDGEAPLFVAARYERLHRRLPIRRARLPLRRASRMCCT
jgi:chromosome segregation ATPase